MYLGLRAQRDLALGWGALRDESQHALRVDAWLKRAGKDLPPEALLRLFEVALGVLWARTETTLGAVTLTAIADRVLHNASEKFPLFSTLTVETTGGIQCLELRARISSVDEAELRDGIRFVLVEFLTVLGNLTSEILTPELHSELSRVTRSKPARADTASEDPRS